MLMGKVVVEPRARYACVVWQLERVKQTDVLRAIIVQHAKAVVAHLSDPQNLRLTIEIGKMIERWGNTLLKTIAERTGRSPVYAGYAHDAVTDFSTFMLEGDRGTDWQARIKDFAAVYAPLGNERFVHTVTEHMRQYFLFLMTLGALDASQNADDFYINAEAYVVCANNLGEWLDRHHHHYY